MLRPTHPGKGKSRFQDASDVETEVSFHPGISFPATALFYH